ncbi:hypothetical protein [Pandoraea commovens]|uniref:Uncharacterized protein n=1 Tax=Pandoraea commovens TaxID=2508289 RepID=A0A5E4SI90_9BURK|nr:hypothetical protein [Pandoraea commovens]VVD74901.1 hypothetical protein PCO31010_00823 [Pandoraea commovens]
MWFRTTLRVQTTNRLVVAREHPKHQIESVCGFACLVGTKNRFDKLARGLARAA